jgi:riboflavin synthase
MFTGLVEEVGVIRRFESYGGGGRLTVQARKVLGGTSIGDSIAVSGACLTVVAVGGDDFAVECMPETLSHTTLGKAKRGAPVNLERSLAVGARLGGHLVLGHVDAVAEVLKVRRTGNASEITFSLPEAVAPYLAAKGSVAIDGVSLTVIGVDENGFRVGVIPHTLEATTLRTLESGRLVNVEADVLARYVHRALQSGNRGDAKGEARGGLTEELLKAKGFL